MHPSFRFMGKKMDLAMVAWVALAWKGLDLAWEGLDLAWKGLDLAWGDPDTGWEVLVTGWVDPDMVENGLNGCQRVGMVEENAAPQRRSGEA